MGGLSGMVFAAVKSYLLKTGQTTCYHVADDGDYEKGKTKQYIVYTTGQYSLTKDIDVAHYAVATISFTAAGSIVADSALGLATILTGDTVVIKGSASNDGTYTVAVGGVAASFTVNEALINEVVGAYVSLYKRAAHSNACVFDQRTRLMWSRATSIGEKVGAASTGTLNWYDATTCFILHPLAADLAIVLPNILRVTGSNELTRYHVGDVLNCAGFANAVNNLPGYVVSSVSFTGGNTDIVLQPFNNTLIAEAAGGSRKISLVCRNIFAYCAAANAIAVGGYADWRICDLFEALSLLHVPTNLPSAVAFPSFPSGSTSRTWVSTSDSASDPTYAWHMRWSAFADITGEGETTNYYCHLVRGG